MEPELKGEIKTVSEKRMTDRVKHIKCGMTYQTFQLIAVISLQNALTAVLLPKEQI